MSEAETILVSELKEIKNLLASNQTDYCDAKEACRIIGLTNVRYLKQLSEDKNVLPRYPRVKSFIYKKSDCYKVAAMLDSKQIILDKI